MLKLPSYLLITPARDEAQFIGLTIESVVGQKVRPIKWVIVSDGSTDGTDDIVKEYAADHSWIELARMPDRQERNFAGKANAFNFAYERVRDLEFEVVGNMDGDLSFDEDYYSYLLQKLAEDPALGLVGTSFKDPSFETYNYRLVGIEHVSGPVQLFRRECFEDIGGYVPVRGGGVDHIALTTARMKGWKTRTFVDKFCLHLKPMGTAESGVLRARLKQGGKDYRFGNHPIWEFLRVVYRIFHRPYLFGGLSLGMGYVLALVRHQERPIPWEMVAFRRREQMQRLRGLLTGANPEPHKRSGKVNVPREQKNPQLQSPQ